MPAGTMMRTHETTCPPGCDDDTCLCDCHSHSPTCWPDHPDPWCICQQDRLPGTEADDAEP